MQYHHLGRAKESDGDMTGTNPTGHKHLFSTILKEALGITSGFLITQDPP